LLLNVGASLEAAAQEESDELACVVNDGEGARAVLVEETFGACERGRRPDEEFFGDGAHHLADARLVPALAPPSSPSR
jgi:hypothetical protein